MSYTVKRGDTLSAIAARNHVSLAALERANPSIKNPNRISVGEKINLPGRKDTFEPPKSSKPSSRTYTVRSGDTLSGIASRFGVSLSALERANPQIKNPSRISVGERVNIPGKGSTSAPKPPTSGGSGKGTNAASRAEKYLGMSEATLQREGVTKPCPYGESCANFVTSMLQQAGAINFHTLGVADLNNQLRARGWKVVSARNAKPGDVWICNGAHGEQHTEIVASNNNGKITLVGSNNTSSSMQAISYDSYSASISGSFILAPA